MEARQVEATRRGGCHSDLGNCSAQMKMFRPHHNDRKINQNQRSKKDMYIEACQKAN